MQMGSGSPEAFVPVLCMQNASSKKSEKSLVPASIQRNANFPTVAKQMRRFSGSRGGAVRRDVLAAADTDVASEEESDHAAW